MDQELVSRIAATAKSDLQLPDEQLPTIERYVKRAISRILVFCGREDFPPPLEDVGFRHVGQSFGSFIRLKGMSWLS